MGYTPDKIFNATAFKFKYFSSDTNYQARVFLYECPMLCSKLSLERKF